MRKKQVSGQGLRREEEEASEAFGAGLLSGGRGRRARAVFGTETRESRAGGLVPRKRGEPSERNGVEEERRQGSVASIER